MISPSGVGVAVARWAPRTPPARRPRPTRSSPSSSAVSVRRVTCAVAVADQRHELVGVRGVGEHDDRRRALRDGGAQLLAERAGVRLDLVGRAVAARRRPRRARAPARGRTGPPRKMIPISAAGERALRRARLREVVGLVDATRSGRRSSRAATSWSLWPWCSTSAASWVQAALPARPRSTPNADAAAGCPWKVTIARSMAIWAPLGSTAASISVFQRRRPWFSRMPRTTLRAVPDVLTDEPLAPRTTLRLGGPARAGSSRPRREDERRRRGARRRRRGRAACSCSRAAATS